MAIAAPMATTDIPTVNGSVIMIISRLASGLAPATVTPNMDWIITARNQKPTICRRWSRLFFARWSLTWRHLRKSDLLIASRLYSSATPDRQQYVLPASHCLNEKVAYRR